MPAFPPRVGSSRMWNPSIFGLSTAFRLRALRCSPITACSLPATRRQLAHVEPEHLRALDRISIEGLEVFANHGVFPEENSLGQKFVVSVTF